MKDVRKQKIHEIRKIKEIKNFIICDETYLYKYNFKNNNLEMI